MALLPDLSECILVLKPELLAALCCDTTAVASKLVRPHPCCQHSTVIMLLLMLRCAPGMCRWGAACTCVELHLTAHRSLYMISSTDGGRYTAHSGCADA
jgi:hypothetical protein